MLFRPSHSSSVLGITFILRTDPPCLLCGCSWVGRSFSDYTEEHLYYTFDSNVFFTLSITLPIQVARFLPYQVVLAVLGFSVVDGALAHWEALFGSSIRSAVVKILLDEACLSSSCLLHNNCMTI